ncbi:MAG: transcriptional regulator, TetR family [Anaerocolumna sp.]|nr:transcriptional regulator, TetR family [Anaerocolumna sp.]
MELKKIDRRVKYTKMVIKDSFVKLLQQKPISKITIKELCEYADINRATFYAHYTDQYDLLQKIEDELVEDINKYLDSYDFKGGILESVEMLEKILEYIKDNFELIDLLLDTNGDIKFHQEIIKIIGYRRFLSLTTIEPTDTAEYIFYFSVHGCMGIIQKWLKDGMKKTPREMAELILKMDLNGRSSFF